MTPLSLTTEEPFNNITTKRPIMKAHTAETLATMTPEKAIQFLKEGNERFLNNLKINRNLLQQVNETKDGQFPFAVVLGCMDSRTSVELIFDQGIGDIFSLRVAGNILTDEMLGSMEYACKFVGSKLILVLGHSKCGATTGATLGKKGGKLETVLEKFDPSIEKAKTEHPEIDPTSSEFVECVTRLNVIRTMNEILTNSEVLKDLFDKGEIAIAGAYYNVDSGEVEFLKEKL